MEKAKPQGRYNISIVGRMNAGKSSLINAICGQDVSITSDIAGTTTDLVKKPYELIGFGPVMFFDTAGLDDTSELGEKRLDKTHKAIKSSDFVIVVVAGTELTEYENNLIENLNKPYLVVFNKKDETGKEDAVSSITGEGIEELKETLRSIMPRDSERRIIADLIKEGDKVLLVCPIDMSAPTGRIKSLQVQVIREILDSNAMAITIQTEQLESAIKTMNPDLVVIDSVVIGEAIKLVPESVPMTTFSMLFSRLKGDFDTLLAGASAIDTLKDGDKILIAEACSHTTEQDDIARAKLPVLLEKYTGKKLDFDFSNGIDFPEYLDQFSLVLHCGSCMLTRTETLTRINAVKEKNIPITNYGMTFSKCSNSLDRTAKIFK